MLIVGLTGSIGMGKSTAAARVRQHGIPVFDADAEVHRLYAGPLSADIEAAFPGTTNTTGVDRQRLSALLKHDPARFRDLEAIVHPAVRRSQQQFLTTHNEAGAKIVVLEVPLLFESGLDGMLDATIVVSAPELIQRQRVLARANMTDAMFAEIMTRQLPDAEKRHRATHIIDTSGTIENSHALVDDVLERLAATDAIAYDRYWRVQ